MIEFYGIPNCDTVKKARAWLDAKGKAYRFHDYKKEGIDPDRLERWIGQIGLERALNRAGTTFRKLPDDQKADLDTPRAIALMVANPSMIRRPIVEYSGGVLAGFNDADWGKAFGD